jgi:chromosome segregation ATPase
MRLKDFITETSTRVLRSRLETRLRQLEADLKDMNVSPSSQKVADAIDDVRDEIKDVKAEIASLKEGTHGYTAEDAQQKHVVTIKQSLDQISQLVEQKYAVPQSSWGAAGDLAHVAKSLEEIVEFLTNPA